MGLSTKNSLPVIIPVVKINRFKIQWAKIQWCSKILQLSCHSDKKFTKTFSDWLLQSYGSLLYSLYCIGQTSYKSPNTKNGERGSANFRYMQRRYHRICDIHEWTHIHCPETNYIKSSNNWKQTGYHENLWEKGAIAIFFHNTLTPYLRGCDNYSLRKLTMNIIGNILSYENISTMSGQLVQYHFTP